MANYDIYKMLYCPVVNNNGIIIEPITIIAVPVIEWQVSLDANNFDMSRASKIPTLSDSFIYAAAAFAPNQEYNGSSYVRFNNETSFGVFVDGNRTDNSGGNGGIDACVLIYDPSRNITALVFRHDGKQYYQAMSYTFHGNDYIGELYTFNNFYPDAVNFYRSVNGEYTDEPIILNKGESSSRLEFQIVFSDSHELYTGEVEYSASGLGTQFTIEDNIITVSETAVIPSSLITAKPAEYPDSVFTFIKLEIPDYDDPDFPGDSGGEDGGNGFPTLEDIFNSSLTIPNGSVEQNDAGAGIYSRWLVSPAQLADMADYIWQQPLDVLTGLLTAIVGKPIDAIIQLTSYPFNVGAYIGGSGGNIKIGNLITDTSGTKLTSNAGSIDWGTINFASSGAANYYGNFLDFSPYTQYKLYLPWGVGFVDIDANDIISISNGKFTGGSISVRTNFEIGKGTAVHNVYNHLGVVIGSYCCDIGRTIPIIGSDYASKSVRSAVGMIGLAVAGGAAIAGASSAISGAVASATTSKLLGMASLELSPRFVNSSRAFGLSAAEKASAIGQGLADTLSNIPRWHRNLTLASAAAVATGTPNTYRNGVFLEGSAGMNIQYPYLIITKPDMSLPENYGRFNGYPSNIYATLGSLRGYTEVAEIHLSGLNATVSELAELEDILKGGVIL